MDPPWLEKIPGYAYANFLFLTITNLFYYEYEIQYILSYAHIYAFPNRNRI